jgi:hypothetical protein
VSNGWSVDGSGPAAGRSGLGSAFESDVPGHRTDRGLMHLELAAEVDQARMDLLSSWI